MNPHKGSRNLDNIILQKFGIVELITIMQAVWIGNNRIMRFFEMPTEGWRQQSGNNAIVRRFLVNYDETSVLN